MMLWRSFASANLSLAENYYILIDLFNLHKFHLTFYIQDVKRLKPSFPLQLKYEKWCSKNAFQ